MSFSSKANSLAESGFQLARRQAEAYEKYSGRFMGPSAQLIVDSADLGAGDVVLDLACGTGLIARAARAKVLPTGRVVGADVSSAMLAAAASLEAPGIEWVEAPAEEMPFDDGAFTHVLCQQGFQFFPNALAAAREARRVLCSGGSLIATIWATPNLNPYIDTQLALLSEVDHTIASSAAAAAPADADRLLREMAASAGFNTIVMSLLEHAIMVEDLEAFFIDQTATTPWGSVLARLSISEQTELAEEFVSRLRPYAVDGGHRLPFCSHTISCKK